MSDEIKKGTITHFIDVNKSVLAFIAIFLGFIRYAQDNVTGLTSSNANALYSLLLLTSYGALLMSFIEFFSNFYNYKDKSTNLYIFGVVIFLFIFLISIIFFGVYINIMSLYIKELLC